MILSENKLTVKSTPTFNSENDFHVNKNKSLKSTFVSKGEKALKSYSGFK